MLFFLHHRDVWRRPSCPAEPRTTLRAPPRQDPARATFVGLSPDLPATPIWPVTRTGLTGTALRHCKELLRMLVGSKRCPQKEWLCICIGGKPLIDWADLLWITLSIRPHQIGARWQYQACAVTFPCLSNFRHAVKPRGMLLNHCVLNSVRYCSIQQIQHTLVLQVLLNTTVPNWIQHTLVNYTVPNWIVYQIILCTFVLNWLNISQIIEVVKWPML
jgi:hypothetical protein